MNEPTTLDAVTNVNVWSLLVVFLLQCLGAYGHWRVMKKEGRVNGNFFTDYLFADYPGKTALTVLLLAGNSWLAALSGAADYLNPQLLLSLIENSAIDIHLGAAITGGVTGAYLAGYGFDSNFNKGSNDQFMDKTEALK